MSAHHRMHRPLNGARKRARKRHLAFRDGAWCTYCGRLFADLRHATIDHVVPVSLFRTWRVEHTVLACLSCNDRKADRLPLLLALLLCTLPDPTVHAGVHESADAAVHEHGESADREHAGSGVHGTVGRVFTLADALWLARTAAAYESGHGPGESADRPHEQSQAGQGEHRPVRTLYALPDPTDAPDRTHPTAHAFTYAPAPTVNARVPDSTAGLDALREAA